MNGNIELHPEHGVNPRMTFCPRCQGPGREIVLLGRHDRVGECMGCECMIFGARTGRKCDACGKKAGFRSMRTIGQQERLPGGLCTSCDEELTTHQKIVEEGGALFKCCDCEATGVIRANTEPAKDVRKEAGLETPDENGVFKPVGVEFSKNTCPACGPGTKKGTQC